MVLVRHFFTVRTRSRWWTWGLTLWGISSRLYIRQGLPNMLADGYVPLECSFGSAVSDFLYKLRIVLLKEFQQGFLLDTDTEIGIFQFGSGHISICLHQFLVCGSPPRDPRLFSPRSILCPLQRSCGLAVYSSSQKWVGTFHFATELHNLLKQP